MRNTYVLGAIQTVLVTFVGGVVFLVLLATGVGGGVQWDSSADVGVPSPVGVQEDDPRWNCVYDGNGDCGEGGFDVV